MVGRARLEVLAAVDVADGVAVRPSNSSTRLASADLSTPLASADLSTRLASADLSTALASVDPVEVARRWQSAGTSWIHLVDVDAAFGRGANHEVIARVAAAVETRVQISGGVTDATSLQRALRVGADRVVVGAAALDDLAWIATEIASHGERVVVGLDVRGDRLCPRGSHRDVGDLWPTLAALDALGCARYVVTDVDTDGAMRGPNLDLLQACCERTDRPVIASGGVSTLDDLRSLRDLVEHGVEGVIVGTALAVGAFTLEDALAAVEG